MFLVPEVVLYPGWDWRWDECVLMMLLQVGEAQTGDAADAENDPDMETGMSSEDACWSRANPGLQRGHGRGWKKWPK